MTYRDRSASVEDRVKDLISRMTLEEKVAQTLCIWEIYNARAPGDFEITVGNSSTDDRNKTILSVKKG